MTKNMIDRVNAESHLILDDQRAVPVLATPAAFVAGVVAGGKATAVVVGAAGVGAAVGGAVNGGGE
ncbi:hypothetical protein ACOACO_01355 [Nocardioides sp. CPCC 205120]|uniref:hypothetical protein n=1 Tax=Nocardioides sp. CPCC 205120 TaxID=3406462 RepID=UPI003B5127DA